MNVQIRRQELAYETDGRVDEHAESRYFITCPIDDCSIFLVHDGHSEADVNHHGIGSGTPGKRTESRPKALGTILRQQVRTHLSEKHGLPYKTDIMFVESE
jgi:hypothetical protein